ncbi:MAG: four helix bundle protein [Planctomycetota bacterium]
MSYRFEKLIVWQKAMDFCIKVYNKTKSFPKDEIYGITSQFRRASTSLPLNIAEGSGCRTKKEFIQFLYIALRSQYEVVTIIKLSYKLGYLNVASKEELENEIAEIGRLLQGLINSLQTKSDI